CSGRTHVRYGRSCIRGAGVLLPQLPGGHPLGHQGLQLDFTLYKGSIAWDTPMLYGLGFIGLFLIGGLTGLFLACLGLDIHIHDSYFVIPPFHHLMVGGAGVGYVGGLDFWWATGTGRVCPGALAKSAVGPRLLGL